MQNAEVNLDLHDASKREQLAHYVLSSHADIERIARESLQVFDTLLGRPASGTSTSERIPHVVWAVAGRLRSEKPRDGENRLIHGSGTGGINDRSVSG